MSKLSVQSGFSAVELLITLFIGFLFVTMGYQLYTVSVQLGGDAREQAKASDIAYGKLRDFEASTATLTCNSTTTDTTTDGSKAVTTTTISCPWVATPLPAQVQNIRVVTVKVKYNVSQKEVAHAMYIPR